MTREERLMICGKCLHRTLDYENGYVCNLTGKVGEFSDACKNFVRDGTVTDSIKLKVTKPRERPPLIREPVQMKAEKSSNSPAKRKLNKEARRKLRKYQSFLYALTGGIIVTIAAAIGWSIAAGLTGFPEIYMSAGIGLLVGLAVRFFGAGINRVFGLLGGILTLAGCLFGRYLIQEGILEMTADMGLREAMAFLRPKIMINSLLDTYVPQDLMFYGLAAILAYFLSIRRIGSKKRIRLDDGDFSGAPALYRLRLPLIIAGILVPVVFGYAELKGTNGKTVQFYDSGWKMSEGSMKLKRETGAWTYWYENGDEKCLGFYNNGLRDSVWLWYDQSGRLTETGRYRKGLEHGTWIRYHGDGTASDSGTYVNGTREGKWKYWYTNGTLRMEGEMNQGKRTGLWKVFHNNGRIAEEILFNGTDPGLVQNVWDPSGHQIVLDGNGEYRHYSRQGGLLETGEIWDGIRTGIWTCYFSNGKISEEGIYVDGRYLVRNSWGLDGVQEVIEGNGIYHSYYEGTTKMMESGEIRNGNREGLWKSYNRNSGSLWEEVEYVRGKQSGLKKIYNESGTLMASGSMVNGVREGEWNCYDENGQSFATVIYKAGKIQGKQILTNTSDLVFSGKDFQDGALL